MTIDVTITDEAKALIKQHESDYQEHALTREELKQSLEHVLSDKQIYKAVKKLAAE
ncbi:hypothetical protein [Lacticaseibacillus porcinae]|uniref:hypothetical protein n=1 Tax=Lacticaseibacillus porcinae TaxID=1123687 RepID=UPI0013DDD827|nr:hypothetical protein [Lacticaseibacillus porcinae]